jgi:hypothetical protein
MICKDCNKKLGKFAKNNHSIRCLSCAIKFQWKSGIRKGTGKYSRRKKIKKCLLCRQKFIIYSHEKKQFCNIHHSQLYHTIITYNETKQLLNKLSKEFLIWFTGFWEGEGSLVREYNKFNKHYHFTMSISQVDNIIYYFRKKFKFGKINKYLKGECLGWTFGGVGHILPLIQIMNPYIKINKRKIQIRKFLKDKYVKELLKYV